MRSGAVPQVVSEWILDQFRPTFMKVHKAGDYKYVLTGRKCGVIKFRVWCGPDGVRVRDPDNNEVISIVHYADPRLFEQLSEVICRLLG